MDIAGVEVEIDVIRELPELENLEVNSSIEDQSFNSSKYGFKNVIIKGIKGEKLDLNPSLEQQNLKGVFTEVNINAIQTNKLNATPSTQEQVITGLFDEVTVNAIEGQELNLNPSEEQQNFEGVFLGVNINPIQVEEITTDLDFSSSDAMELTAQEGVYIKKTTINKPINLTPENIKSGETVCGIAGKNADTSDADATSDDIVAGKTAYVANEKIEGTFIPLDTSDATATAEDILEGKTAYVNGEKVIGTFNPLYTKLEYITSDGNAYIDTGVQALSTIGVELNVKCTNTKATAFFGAWSNEKGIIFGQAYYSSAMQGYAMAANGSWVFADGSSSFNTSIFHKYIYDPINNVYTIDGKTVNLVKNTGLNINMWLFRAYEWSEKGSDISVSSCKIYDNGVLIRDYIPVKRKVDNVACMYDLVNKEFVLPSNGTFIAGPEI